MTHIYSTYRMRDGDPSPYGDFECRILGEPLIVTVDRLDDDDPRALDMLGVPIRRKDAAVHISGIDEYLGDGTGFVREIGWWSAKRADGRPVQSTARHPEAVIICKPVQCVVWNKHHVAEWSEADYFVTRRGVETVYADGTAFGPADIARRIDAALERSTLMPLGEDPQHVRAIRRLLEGTVGGGRLVRHGRWSYRVTGGAS